MKKIVYLLTYFDSQTGGMERQAMQLAKKLQKKGYEIFFITCAHIAKMRRDHLRVVGIKEGFRIYRIPLFGGARYLNSALYGIGALTLLLLLRARYKIIHAHQLYTSGVIAAFAKLFLHSKMLIVKDCCGGEFSDVKFLHALPLSAVIMEQMRKSVDQWIAISEETKKELETEKFQPIVFISNGVDTIYFEPADAELKLALRSKMNIVPQEKIILFVGKFDPQKNIPVLLEAMRKTQSHARLLIVGDGLLRPSLERYVVEYNLHDKVRFCGNTKDIKAYYQIADIFVLPSRAEGVSNVLLEAMSCGLPVIGSDIASIRALVKHGGNGYLIPLDDAPALAFTIDHAFAHVEEARRIGRAARAFILERFSLDSVSRLYTQLYESKNG